MREALKLYYNHSRRYIAEMQSHDEEYFGDYPVLVTSHIVHLLGTEGRLLEIGCGGGASTNALAARLPRFRCTGLDISEPAIALASSRFSAVNLDYQTGDSLELPFADASLDVVTSRDVIEHLPDVGRAFAEMARVVKPGGLVIIRSPHHRSPLFALADLLRLRTNYPFTKRPLDNLPRFLSLSADFVAKLFVDEPRFHYRTPDLSDDVQVGLDADAVYEVYEVSSLDLITFFRNLGFQVHNVGATYGSSHASKLVPRLLPYLASVGLVVQRPR